ncbi:hypothetical protein M011DRAFT_327119 [Sporormia fimetaria CBS 119925]|uniref:Uncharacterized protein n=1 Tax=Sporormia fimetaria CBS 119925 TaxID=1340428 RepID=A0A6A6VEX4_9PLEO|nr:hypothetical protein M011DRAFT_327119 [Sporormia fimetaria CBS 119925]
MDPQPPPPPAATTQYATHHVTHGHHEEHSFNEKDVYYQSHDSHPAQHSYGYHPTHAAQPHFTQSRRPPPSPPSTVSSHKQRAHDIEHAPPLNPNIPYPQQAHVDPEKAAYLPRRDANVTTILYDSDDYPSKGPEEKPVQLLLFLSGPCVLLSILIAIWTFFSLLVSLILQPFRLCSAARPPLSSQLTTFLAPPLNLQLQLIYSAPGTEYSVPMLVVVHLFSPIVALGVAIGAWTAACFWFFSAILGDPTGPDQDQPRNDGKDSLLGVRRWWDRWLSRALRDGP